jgi:hypothetical protein
VRSIERLADRRVVLDVELVAEAGTMVDFYAVRPALAGRQVVAFVAFDVLWLDGELLTSRPQQERRRILDGLALPIPVIAAFPLRRRAHLVRGVRSVRRGGHRVEAAHGHVLAGAALCGVAEGEGRRTGAPTSGVGSCHRDSVLPAAEPHGEAFGAVLGVTSTS